MPPKTSGLSGTMGINRMAKYKYQTLIQAGVRQGIPEKGTTDNPGMEQFLATLLREGQVKYEVKTDMVWTMSRPSQWPRELRDRWRQLAVGVGARPLINENNEGEIMNVGGTEMEELPPGVSRCIKCGWTWKRRSNFPVQCPSAFCSNPFPLGRPPRKDKGGSK